MNNKILSPRNITIAVSMLVTAALAYFLVINWLFDNDDPASLIDVENAVFTSIEPSALIYGNIRQAQRLLGLLGDAEIEEKANLAISKAPSIDTIGSSDALLSASDFFVSSLATGDDGSLSNWLTVVQGRYLDLDVKAELAERYTLQDVGNGRLLIQFKSASADDDFKCPADDTKSAVKPEFKKYAHLSDTQIVMSSSLTAIDVFLETYSQQSGAPSDKQHSLSQWRDYRQGSLFSMSVFDKQLLSQDFTAQLASEALLGDARYERVGLRANLNLTKQSLRLSFDAGLNDKSTADGLAEKIKSGIADLNRANEKTFPSVTDLLSRVSVRADSGLHLGLELDKNIAPEIENVVSDFISMIFNPSASASDDGNDEPQEEVLNKFMWDYALNEKVSQQSSLPEDQFQLFLPLAKKGSVAFFMKSLGVEPISSFDKEQGETLQLAIQAKRPAEFGNAFHGWSDSGIKQHLSITQVLDKDGNNLLLDERCKKTKFSQELNHQANESSSYSKGAIESVKKVRLMSDVHVSQISKVVGKYSFSAPIDIELRDITLKAPSQTWGGGSFQLTDIKNGSVSYVFKDKESRLLDVIGLNAAGQALSYSSSFGSGSRYTKQFKGEVATVRIALAGNFEQESFSFEIDSIIPEHSKAQQAERNVSVVYEPKVASKLELQKFSTATSLENLNDDQTEEITSKIEWIGFSLDASKKDEVGNMLVGSGMIFLRHDPQSSWNHKLTGLLLMPHSDVLLSANGLVTLKFNIDGQSVEPAVVSISKTTSNGQIVPPISVDTVELGLGSFSIPFEEKRDQIKIIEGVLEYTFPTKINVRTIKPGAADGVIKGLTFVGYDFGLSGKTKYKLDAPLAKANAIVVTTIDGVEHLSDLKTDKGATTVEFASLEAVQKMELYFADESEVITEEFKFVPSYP